jgi:hypothetical protein
MEITGMSAWQQLRRELEHSPRSQAWRIAGCWALDSAERHLGSNWLARHAGSGRPVPGMFLHPGSDLFTSPEVVYGVTGADVTGLPEYGVSP